MRRPRIGVLTLVALWVALTGTSPVFGQDSSGEHEQHHEGEAGSGAAGPQGKGGGMGGGMGKAGGKGGGMNGGMGKGGGKGGGKGMDPAATELLPLLMKFPEISAARAEEIEKLASERMVAGLQRMRRAIDEILEGVDRGNLGAAQNALLRMRVGLAEFQSGVAGRRIVAEGRAPQEYALRWFKQELDLLPPPPAPKGVLFGLSMEHLVFMLITAAVAAGALVLYVQRTQRASHLFAELTSGSTESAVAAVSVDAAESAGAARGATVEKPDESAEISSGLIPVRKRKVCHMRVARIFQETPDVKTFRFISCDGGRIGFNYLPGQFLTLTLPTDEKPIRRSYTISSSPTQAFYCEITVKREDKGAGSRYLHDQVHEGDNLEVRAPSGKFLFTGKESDSVVLIGGGVGITPMMSIARALTDMSWSGEIHFIVSCRDPEHFIFESELKKLQERHPNLRLHAAMSRIEHDIDGYRRGRLSRELLSEWVPDIASKWVQLCGAPPMMESTKQLLTELGVPPENIHTENFGSLQKPRARAAEHDEAEAAAPTATTGTVTFKTSGKSTPIPADETVLEAAERIDVDIEYSCRVGTCGMCVVKLLSGSVSMEVEDGLEPEDREAGMILACQARTAEDVAVEA